MSLKHFENLSSHIDNLSSKSILDLGSGDGNFLVAAAKKGARAVGLELNQEYIDKSNKLAEIENVNIDVVQGLAEKMPFIDNSFDFINISEVIEHVDDPGALLKEVYRVLKPSGQAYISVPNRFSFRDQHFHLYFINWLPRFTSDIFISIFGKHKDYSDQSAGLQRLKDMHYYTYGQMNKLAKSFGFTVKDIREEKIKKISKSIFLLPIYRIIRTIYFDSFHLILTK